MPSDTQTVQVSKGTTKTVYFNIVRTSGYHCTSFSISGTLSNVTCKSYDGNTTLSSGTSYNDLTLLGLDTVRQPRTLSPALKVTTQSTSAITVTITLNMSQTSNTRVTAGNVISVSTIQQTPYGVSAGTIISANAQVGTSGEKITASAMNSFLGSC